jgi:hypothetical protein
VRVACEELEARVILSVNTPTGLVGAKVTQTEIVLQWKDNSGEEYSEIERYVGSASGTPERVIPVSAGWESWQDTDGLVSGTTYAYKMRGFKAGNTPSPYSNEINISSAGQPMARAANQTTVNVAWGHFASGQTGYVVERKVAGGGAWFVISDTLWSNVTTYIDTPVSQNVSYQYRIKALGPNVYSAASLPFTPASAPTIPAAPSGLTTTGVAGGGIELHWIDNSTNEEDFILEYKKDGESQYHTWTLGSIGSDATSYTIWPGWLEPGARYTFHIRAHGQAGDSAWSNTASRFLGIDQGQIEIGPPDGGLGRTHALHVTWPNATGEAGYDLYRSNDGTNWVSIASLGADVTSYDDRGSEEPGGVLAESTWYWYGVVIRAANGAENSGRSEGGGQTAAFLLIDAPQGEWHQPNPFELDPIPPKPGVYDQQWISVGPVDWGDMELDADDEARARASARAAKSLVIDVEHWPEDQRESGAAAVQDTIDKFKQLIAWVRDEWAQMEQEGIATADLRLGFYEACVNSFWPFQDPHDPQVMQAWRASNDVYGEIMQPFTLNNEQWDGVDVLVPSFYTNGTNWSDWIWWTRLQLEEFRRLGDQYGLPVYVFVHPRDAFNWDEVPLGMWRYELESVRSIVDGVAVWYSPTASDIYHIDSDFSDDPWYVELGAFRDQWDRLPPGAPSPGSVEPYGPFLSWTDTDADDQGHDARGWVVERSRNGTDWVPVGGGYAGGEQTIHDYYARNGTGDYQYRVRAINAFGSTPSTTLYPPFTPHRDASRVEAELTDDRSPYITSASTLNNTYHTTWTRYNDVNFGQGDARRLLVRYQKINNSTIHVWAMPPDTAVTFGANGWSLSGSGVTEIATVPVQTTGNAFLEFEVPMSSYPSGVRDVMLTFEGAQGLPPMVTLVLLDWMQFLPPTNPAPAAPLTVFTDPSDDVGTSDGRVTDGNRVGPPAVPRSAPRPRRVFSGKPVRSVARTAAGTGAIQVPPSVGRAPATPFSMRRRRVSDLID